MDVVTVMPKDLIASTFEPHKMSGAKLAYRFIREVNEDKPEKGKRKNVKLCISPLTEKQFPTFHSGNAEDSSDLIMVHKSIVSDMKLVVRVKVARAVKAANGTEITALEASDPVANAEKIKEL